MAAVNGVQDRGVPYILLFLVRHGQTPENKNDIFQGQIDTFLSEEGIEQAQLVGTKLQDEQFSHIFSSDLSRARNTAEEIIRKSNFCSHLKIEQDSRLRERCYGIAEGCSKPEFLQMAAKLSSKPRDFVPEGAETLDQVRRRVGTFFDSMIDHIGNSFNDSNCATCETQNHPGHQTENKNCVPTSEEGIHKGQKSSCVANLLVVSHGGAIRELLYYIAEKYPTKFLEKPRIGAVSPNTGVSKFQINLNEQTKAIEFVTCFYLHNADHLKDTKDHF